LPSYLNIVKLPSPASLTGASQHDLYLNINLRRFGCGGRAGLSLGKPTAAQQDKFLSMYQLHPVYDAISFADNLLTLVGLVHKALALFGLGPLAKDLALRMHEANVVKSVKGTLAREIPSDGLRAFRCLSFSAN
jgi:hypothetical protein